MALVLTTDDTDKPPPAEPSRPASPSEPPPVEAPSPPPSKPKPPGPLIGDWPRALVLLACLATLVALASTHTLDLGSGGVLMAIAGAAGAQALRAGGRLPTAGTAALLVGGVAALFGEAAARLRL